MNGGDLFIRALRVFIVYWSLGFSRWGPWIHARSCLRPSHSISRKPRIRFWWFFAQIYIMMSLKKCSKQIFVKKSCFQDFGQKWPIFAIFGHFRSKIRFSDIFFETAHQICLKLGQKLGTIALYHLKAVLWLGKFLFWPFWPFLGQKYIACGDIIWFWAVFGHFRQNHWWFFFVI